MILGSLGGCVFQCRAHLWCRSTHQWVRFHHSCRGSISQLMKVEIYNPIVYEFMPMVTPLYPLYNNYHYSYTMNTLWIPKACTPKHKLCRESQVEPNMVTHSAVLSACEKAGQWQWALKHWLEMRNAGEKNGKIHCREVVTIQKIGQMNPTKIVLLVGLFFFLRAMMSARDLEQIRISHS